MNNNILRGKIISRQIEIFHEGMKVAYWRDGWLGGYCGWVTGNLLGIPRLQRNGEILAIIKWDNDKEHHCVHCQTSVFHLKEFVMSYEPPPRLESEIESLFKKYIRVGKDNLGKEVSSCIKLPLANFQWESVIEKNQVDTDTLLDFKIKEIPDYDKNFIVFDMSMKEMAEIC